MAVVLLDAWYFAAAMKPISSICHHIIAGINLDGKKSYAIANKCHNYSLCDALYCNLCGKNIIDM